MTTPAIIIVAPLPKFPDETLDYLVDWSPRLQAGETVITCSATVTRGSATATGSVMAGAQQTFWLAGGTAGEDTWVKLKITTSSNPARIHEVVFRVQIGVPA